jgi:hypothetical protein
MSRTYTIHTPTKRFNVHADQMTDRMIEDIANQYGVSTSMAFKIALSSFWTLLMSGQVEEADPPKRPRK